MQNHSGMQFFQVDTHLKLQWPFVTYRLLYNIHSQCTMMHIEMLSICRAIQILGSGRRTEKSSLQISISFLPGKGIRENHVDISNSFFGRRVGIKGYCVVSLLAESSVTYKCFLTCTFPTASQSKWCNWYADTIMASTGQRTGHTTCKWSAVAFVLGISCTQFWLCGLFTHPGPQRQDQNPTLLFLSAHLTLAERFVFWVTAEQH